MEFSGGVDRRSLSSIPCAWSVSVRRCGFRRDLSGPLPAHSCFPTEASNCVRTLEDRDPSGRRAGSLTLFRCARRSSRQAQSASDDAGQVRSLTSSANLSRSILPPETTQTIGPSHRLIRSSAAASDSAPAPSATVRDFSAISRIASRVWSSVTVIDAVDHRPHPLPHALDDALARRRRRRRSPANLRTCAARLRAATRRRAPPSPARRRALSTSGCSALIALPTPVISPPPPIAQMTVRTSGRSSRISSPIVAVAGDEIVIVERVDERAVHAREMHAPPPPPTLVRRTPARSSRRARASGRAWSAARSRSRRPSTECRTARAA